MFRIIHGIQDMNHMLEVQDRESPQQVQVAIQSNGTEENEGMSAMTVPLVFTCMKMGDAYMKEQLLLP